MQESSPYSIFNWRVFTLNWIYNHSEVDESTEQHVKLSVTGKYFPKSLKTQEISLYLIALLLSYSLGSVRFDFGGTTGEYPFSTAFLRIFSPS